MEELSSMAEARDREYRETILVRDERIRVLEGTV
jgi:hypothetical protein